MKSGYQGQTDKSSISQSGSGLFLSTLGLPGICLSVGG